MKLQDIIHNWLLGGADSQVGLRLFLDYCEPNKAIARIVAKSPESHLQTIKTALLKKANLPYNIAITARTNKTTHHDDRPTRHSELVSESASDKHRQPKLRNQWPFLSDPECPPELKLLISDKITAYRNCVQEYDNLTNATTPEEQLDTTRALVTNFIDNHLIYKELKTYKNTGKVLGEHPIFRQYQRIRDLRNLNTMDLFKKKKNLEHAIWRNEAKVKKEKRPDLLYSRQEKIKELKMQLGELCRLLL